MIDGFCLCCDTWLVGPGPYCHACAAAGCTRTHPAVDGHCRAYTLPNDVRPAEPEPELEIDDELGAGELEDLETGGE